MSIVGFQDFWVAGARFYYQRDPVAAVEQPWIDLGVVQPINPALEIEKLELEDSDGGVKSVVDERVTKIDETYDITCSNLNMDNLSLLFLADPPEAFAQAAALKQIDTTVFAGRLAKLHDDDAAKTPLYGVDAIGGCYTGAIFQDMTLTDIDAANKSFTITGSAATLLNDGDLFILTLGDMVASKNSRTYTVDGTPPNATTIPVVEMPVGDETSVTAPIIREDTGTIYAQGVTMDWEVYNTERGFIRLIEGGAIASGQLFIVFDMAALTGNRLIKPQSFKGEIVGLGIIAWGRGNFAEQSVREARISVTPSSSNIQIDDFSNFVISVKVISDLQAADVAGRLIYFLGALPTSS